MNINPINNNQNTNNTFKKLKKVTCANGSNNLYEKRLKLELKNISSKNIFFQENDVSAFIKIQKGIACLNLSYQPIAKTFTDKLRNFFTPPTELKIEKYNLYPDEGLCYLIKKIQKIKNYLARFSWFAFRYRLFRFSNIFK